MRRSRVDALANGIFLMILGLLFYFNWWWPGILVAIWANFIIRQLFTWRIQDVFLTTLLLGSLFVVAYFQLSWDLLTPILFICGGAYLIFREYMFDEPKPPE